MGINLNDLDGLLGYDPATHSIAGMPTMGNNAHPAIAARNGMPPPAAPEMNTPGYQPDVMATGLPSLRRPQATSADLPSLAQQSGRSVKQEGQAQFKLGMPHVTDQPETPGYYQQKEEVNDYQKQHPWGSDISAHPGFLGKVGHALGEVGNIAGTALAPGVMINVPGSTLNRRLQTNENLRGEVETEKPELAELAGEQKGELQAQRDAESDKRLKETLGSREGIAKEGNATKEDIAGQGNENKMDIAQLEAANRAAIAAGKPQPTKTIMQGGAAHIMERDPKTGQYSIDRGEAPPNYAMVAPSLKTIDIIDPQTGLPTVETLGGEKKGISATGGYGHEMAQAGAVERGGNDLITELRDPDNRAIMGSLVSYLRQGTLGTPLADARAAKLVARLHSFSYTNPAMHAFRSKSAGDAFDKIVGGLAQDPDATIGAIEGIQGTAEAINPGLKGQGGGGTSGTGPKVGDLEDGYRFKGGDPKDKNNWEKQ